MALPVPVPQIVAESRDPLLAVDPSWARVPLGHIAKILNGYAFKSAFFSKENGTPLLRIRDVGRNETECFYDGPYEERYIVKSGDLVVGMDGDFKSARWGGSEALLNQRVCKIELVTKHYDPRFLDIVLPGYLKAIHGHTSSVTVRHLSSNSIADIPLPLPPLAEQKRIVAKVEELLGCVNAARERLAKVKEILKRFRQSVLAAACSGRLTEDWREKNPNVEPASVLVDRVMRSHALSGSGHGGKAAPPTEGVHDLKKRYFPNSWTIVELKWLTEPGRAITYGILKPGLNQPDGIPYVRVADFPYDNIQLDSVRKTTDSIAAQYKRSALISGDILLSIRGTVGRVCRVPSELDGANITQDTARISANHEVSADYLEIYLRSPATRRRLEKAMKGVAVRGVNIGDVRALQIAVPPRSEQDEIVNRITTLFALIERIENSAATASVRADMLTQAILAKAFSGALMPTEAEVARREGRPYEPASALLAKIKAQSGINKLRRKREKSK